MAKRMGIGSIFLQSGFEKPQAPQKKPRNLHTEHYDDDGKVITISLEKFFSGFSEYSKFLNDGSRSHMSLTDKEGNEVFQFSMVGAFKGAALDEMKPIIVDRKGTPSKNIKALIEGLSEDSDEPMIMQTAHEHVYGILYPMVRLEKE